MARCLLLPHALLVAVLLFFSTPAAGQDSGSKDAETSATKALSIEEIFSDDDSAPPRPSQVRWTTGDRLSFFLKAEKPEKVEDDSEENGEENTDTADAEDDDDPGRDLWIMDIASGEKEILLSADDLSKVAPSPTQATTDERERTRRSRFAVAAYRWSPDGEKILFTSSGKLLLYSLESRETTTLASTKKNVLDPKFSPDGQWVAFVYEHDIWVVPTSGGKELQLTTGGHDLLLHGDLDWVYPEEFGVRTGYHWSPDSEHIAFLEMDQSPVPTYPIVDELSWQATVDFQRYPKPGDPNPKVRVGIVGVESRKTAWLDRAAEYIPRIDWADADHVAVQLLDRDQEELELVLADPSNGRSRSVFFERDPHWVNVTKDLTFIEGTDHFLWTSERTGLRHIYLYERSGKLVRQLTSGEFQVSSIQGFDAEEGWVYFTSNERNLLGSDLYRVHLDGTDKALLTKKKGSHRLQMNDSATAYLDSFSSTTDPGGQSLHHLASGKVTQMRESRDYSEYDLVQPTMKTLVTEDGATVRLTILAPENPEPGVKLPVLTYVYGMAGFPVIRDSWAGGTRSLFHQYLVQEGYVVVSIDDRSSSIPGHKYAITADHNVGPVAAKDHEFAVEYLRTLPFIDPERMAIWGWSGGGFSTAFHMGHTDLFKVGIAGAAPTDWRLYDSIYTERYMGLPDEDPEAYERTSALEGAENVKGRLMLIHGTHDDNVHPQNTTKMIDALIKAGKQFDVMLYPNKTHGVSGDKHRRHMYTMIFDYLELHL